MPKKTLCLLVALMAVLALATTVWADNDDMAFPGTSETGQESAGQEQHGERDGSAALPASTETPAPTQSPDPALPPEGAVSSGWYTAGGKWYYYIDGKPVVDDWIQVDGRRYHLNSSGMLHGGLCQIGEATYYLNERHDGCYGAAVTGWKQLGKDWYYFDPADGGAMKVSGWQRDGNGLCYLGEDGKMVTGWLELEGATYYLRESGKKIGTKVTGWQMIGNDWYCFDGEGAMIAGDWAKDGDHLCYLGEEGRLLSGWQTIDGVTYYLWQRHDGGFGAKSVRPTYIDGQMYMFDSTGALVTDTQVQLLGKTWTVDEKGVIQNYLTTTSAQAVAVLNQVGWNLRSAFNWSFRLPYSNRNLRAPAGSIHSDFYANYGFKNKTGNCYAKACTFYQMARVMGYEVYFVEGHVANALGGLGADHGWTEIIHDGQLYVYDLTFTNAMGMNGFRIQYRQPMTWRYQYYERVA